MITSLADISSPQRIPTVSVVIPVFNAARYLGDALDSVSKQTFTDYEVIVVNDGSSDTEELERILTNHAVPVVYLTQRNRGVSAARNAGIKAARGKFYAQLDADDQWTPEYLATQVGILCSEPDVALVYPNAMIFGDSVDMGVEFMKLCPSVGEVTFESLISEKCIVMTCVTARMSAIRDAGMFDEKIRSCEDFDLWLRIVKNGGRIIYHRQVLARYRRRQGSLSSDRVWMTKNLLSVFEKCANTLDLSEEERSVLSEQTTHRRASLELFEGKQALSQGDTIVARIRFIAANAYFQSPKLAFIILLLKHLPQPLVWIFNQRQRFLAATKTLSDGY